MFRFHQKPDDEVDALVKEMLGLLMKYQERARIKDAVKAKARRRLVFGLREVGPRPHLLPDCSPSLRCFLVIAPCSPVLCIVYPALLNLPFLLRRPRKRC